MNARNAFCIVLVVMLGVLSWQAPAQERTYTGARLLASFETQSELARCDSSGEMSLSEKHITQGKRALKISYGIVRPSFEMTTGDTVWDFSGHDKLKLDIYLDGAPMIVTMRISDKPGKTYTSWYYLIREGYNVVEYSILGMSSVIDVSQVSYFRFSTESAYTQTYVVDASELDSGRPEPKAAIIYMDNLRLTRGEDDDSWLISAGEAKPLVQVPGNVIQNGDFELGMYGWSSWGTWDDGQYIFGSGAGDDAYSGFASASIICQKQGRGGFWANLPVSLDAGVYDFTFFAKGRGDDVRMFYNFEGAGAEFISANRGSPRFDVPEEWVKKTYQVEVSEKAQSIRLYFYSVGGGTLFIDAVSLAREGAKAQKEPETRRQLKPSKVEMRGAVTYVNGEPFFPVGFYHGDPKGLKGTGFNFTVHGIPDKDFLDECLENGIMVTPNLQGVMRVHLPGQAPAAARPFRDHPAVFGWYVCDEPDHARWNVPPPEMRLATKLLHEYDPDHLTWTVVMPWADSNIYQYADTVDIISTDVYPINKNKPCDLLKIARGTDVMRRAVRGKKPVWIVPQSSSVAMPEEEYCVTYLAIAHGANGIIYWEYNDARKNPEIWESMVKISIELKELTPVLTSITSDKEVTVSDKNIHAIMKEVDDNLYLIAVSAKPEPIFGVRITLPKIGEDNARVLFENRSVPIEDGVIADDFNVYERHVYEIPGL
jgi:hypothetical protein